MISFELSPEEAELQCSTHRFAKEQMRPLARPCEEEGVVAQTLVDAFWNLGLAALGYPDHVGGMNVGISTAVVVEEELAWGDAGIAFGVPRIGSAAAALAAVPMPVSAVLRDGERSFVVLETTSVASFTAREESGAIVVSGKSGLIPAVNRADFLLVPCELSGDRALLLLPLRAPDVHVSVGSHQLGLRAAPFGTATAENCRVPPDHVVARGEAARAALLPTLEWELLLLTARAVGIARAAFDYAAHYAMQRTTFGRAIAEHQAVAFMIADIGIRVDAARALLWHAAWCVDAKSADRQISVATAGAFAVEHLVALASDALQILGGHGYIQDHPVEKWMRDARALANYSVCTMETLAALMPQA